MIDEHHPVITAMCCACYGKGQNYKLKHRKAMLRALNAALKELRRETKPMKKDAGHD
jgi:hypothetical protein